MRTIIHKIKRAISFKGSKNYWEKNYARGGTSGEGSYGVLATFKSEVINAFVKSRDIQSVIEFGCGDGNQLSLASYPNYIGIDVSQSAVERCRAGFSGDSTKTFLVLTEYSGEMAECALSLDVIYHLVEDDVYKDYMCTLFNAATRFVIIYSTDHEEKYGLGAHVRHRKFSDRIDCFAPGWCLIEKMENQHKPKNESDPRHMTSPANFYFYGKAE